LNLRIRPIDLVTYWRRCSAIANFVADYYKKDKNDFRHENIISTVFNEIIENASKYSTKQFSDIDIEVSLFNAILFMQMKNYSNKLHAENLIKRIKLLTDINTNLEELYLKEMYEKSQVATESGIGLLMLLKDYNIQIGAKFSLKTEDIYEVIIQIFYLMEEI